MDRKALLYEMTGHGEPIAPVTGSEEGARRMLRYDPAAYFEVRRDSWR